MQLVRAAETFEVHGITYPGFPILLDSGMQSVTAANQFLRYHLIHRGRVASRKSWATLSQHLLDYFRFLEDKNWHWRTPMRGGVGPLSSYRESCIAERKLHPRTVNQRLTTITRFYRYALTVGLIDELPFRDEKVFVTVAGNELVHLTGRRRQVTTPDVMMRLAREAPKYLPSDQVRALLKAATNPTHRLMIRMALQTGLRREELATFPAGYVFDPAPAASSRRSVSVYLDPMDGHGIKTKGGRPREIRMSKDLMADLWSYRIHRRQQQISKASTNPRALFVTARGVSWSEDGKGFLRVLARLGKSIGIAVWPHLLRHTYATYTLMALHKAKTAIDPLVFVQRQLGHSSISMTLVYAHLVAELADEVVTSYDEEVTAWSREG